MMYHIFWFDDDGNAHHTQADTVEELVKELGGFGVAKAILDKQYQPEMRTGATLVHGDDLIWNYDESGNVMPSYDESPDPDWEA